jgi:hypothetical protein
MARDVALGKEQGFKGSDGMGWRASEQCFGEEEDDEDVEDGQINSTENVRVEKGGGYGM